MEFDAINLKLTDALQKVLEDDQYLLEHKINERTISHRLALYLEPDFPGFNIDCEYDGNIDADSGKKYVQLLAHVASELGMLREDEEEQEFVYRCVIPDIIVHRRGHNGSENNLLIIEVKKSSNKSNGAWDAEKLSRFTSNDYENEFNYQYGAFVKFTLGEQLGFTTDWYQNGERIP